MANKGIENRVSVTQQVTEGDSFVSTVTIDDVTRFHAVFFLLSGLLYGDQLSITSTRITVKRHTAGKKTMVFSASEEEIKELLRTAHEVVGHLIDHPVEGSSNGCDISDLAQKLREEFMYRGVPWWVALNPIKELLRPNS